MIRDEGSVRYSELFDFLNAIKNKDAERIKNISFYGDEIVGENYKLRNIGNNNLEVSEVLQTSQIMRIPKTIDGKNVIGIGENAFYGNLQVETVEIPEGVQYIKPGAFAYCVNLRNIKLPNSLRKIGERCYSDDENAIFYKKNYIGAFEHCDFEKIDLPNKLEFLGDNSFKFCLNLKSVTIPNSVKIIGRYCFSFCKNMYRVVLPNKLKSIQNGTFYKCLSLSKITLPESIKSIKHYAFGECSSLSEVKTSNDITFIGIGAFKNCEEMQETHNLTNLNT